MERQRQTDREVAAFNNLMLEATYHVFRHVLSVIRPKYGRGQQNARSGDQGRPATTGQMSLFYSGRVYEAPARGQAALWSLGFNGKRNRPGLCLRGLAF